MEGLYGDRMGFRGVVVGPRVISEYLSGIVTRGFGRLVETPGVGLGLFVEVSKGYHPCGGSDRFFDTRIRGPESLSDIWLGSFVRGSGRFVYVRTRGPASL